MSRRFTPIALALATCAATTATAVIGGTVQAAGSTPPTEILAGGPPVTPLKNAAMIERTPWGFRYTAGQQNSHLTVSIRHGKIRYADTGTRELRTIPRLCSRRPAARGIAALCRIPGRYGAANPMFLEVWPRLGNDYVNGSTMPSMFRMWVLADQGADTVYGGNGNDFVNGASQDDTAYGGAGNDWLRTGTGNDQIWGEAGNDNLVGVDGHDVIRGGGGNDRMGGGLGNDVLHADAGADVVACGGGTDRASGDGSDRYSACEATTRR